MNDNIFTMKDINFTQSDFANYIETYTRGRIYGQKESSLRTLYNNYAEKAILDYQENILYEENEEYRNLLNEYRDGIMLFELTDKRVWSKASSDTTGLKEFFEQNQSKYVWGPAIDGIIYKTSDEEYAKKLVKELNNPSTTSPDEIVKAVNGDGIQNNVSYEKGKFEQSRFPAYVKLEAGKYAPYYKNPDGSYTLVQVNEVIRPGTMKSLKDAKGYAISDYQEYLEKQWIAELESKYPVSLNEGVFKSMLK
ncbi:MAG: hypothetical protein R2831_10275 [Chitinophagaceae bacterium]